MSKQSDYYSNWIFGPETRWIEQLRRVPIKMLERLSNVQRCIDSFEKGYLIHREHITLSTKKQILYSMTLDKRLEFPGRNKPKFTEAQAKEFRKKLEARVVEDIN